VQLRVASGLTSEEYVSKRAWQQSSLSRCPLHPKGGCGFRSVGSYQRKQPAGLRIRRWYCPRSHRSFALVPDFAATRVAASLAEIEAAVLEAEQGVDAGESLELVARRLRPDIEVAGAVRWLRRRRHWVAVVLAVVVGLAPELLAGRELSLSALRVALGAESVLERVRELVAPQLASVPAPVGFAPLPRRRLRRSAAVQQSSGPDPPRPSP